MMWFVHVYIQTRRAHVAVGLSDSIGICTRLLENNITSLTQVNERFNSIDDLGEASIKNRIEAKHVKDILTQLELGDATFGFNVVFSVEKLNTGKIEKAYFIDKRLVTNSLAQQETEVVVSELVFAPASVISHKQAPVPTASRSTAPVIPSRLFTSDVPRDVPSNSILDLLQQILAQKTFWQEQGKGIFTTKMPHSIEVYTSIMATTVENTYTLQRMKSFASEKLKEDQKNKSRYLKHLHRAILNEDTASLSLLLKLIKGPNEKNQSIISDVVNNLQSGFKPKR